MIQESYRMKEWTSGTEDLHDLHRLRYRVLVEEMGKYHDRADHAAEVLVDEEDARSWHCVALADDGTIAAANRITWGGQGFSDRQIEQYQLEPWIDAGLAKHICVGERTMVAPEHRGGPAVHQLTGEMPAYMDDFDIRIVFGVCEPHLLSLYISMGQTPYATRNINSEEAGYLIPLVFFNPTADSLRGVGTNATDADGRPSLPLPVAQAVSGTSTVMSRAMVSPDVYLGTIRAELDRLAEAQIGAFDGFTEGEIERCVARSNIITCDVGDRVLKAGGTSKNIFVVLHGTLEAHVDGRIVGVLTAGDAFGETAFLLDMPRTADIYAATPEPRVLSMSDSAVRKMIAEDPTLAAKFLLNVSRMLCSRLIRAN
jgi:hypothetical protein